MKTGITLGLLIIAFVSASFGVILSEQERTIMDFKVPEEVTKDFPYLAMTNLELLCMYLDLAAWPLGNLQFRVSVSTRNLTEVNNGERAGFICIVNLDGFPVWKITHAATLKFTLSLIQEWAASIKAVDVKILFIINANSVFMTLWDLTKSLLGDMNKIIHTHGNNLANWKVQLLKHIPKAQLPEVVRYIQLFSSRKYMEARRSINLTKFMVKVVKSSKLIEPQNPLFQKHMWYDIGGIK